MDLNGLIGDSELAFDIALHDARVILSVDFAEDGTIERLLWRLAVGRRPQMAFEDGFEDFLAVHRVFGSGLFENFDGGTEERHALDGLVGFVGGVEDVLVVLGLDAWTKIHKKKIEYNQEAICGGPKE